MESAPEGYVKMFKANKARPQLAKTSDRVTLIEDTRELQCKAANFVALRTKEA